MWKPDSALPHICFGWDYRLLRRLLLKAPVIQGFCCCKVTLNSSLTPSSQQRFWRLEQDKIGSKISHCWSMSKFFLGSLTRCTVRAILMDSMVFIINLEMILTYPCCNCLGNGDWELCTSAGAVVEWRVDVRLWASKITKLVNEANRFYMLLKFEMIWSIDLVWHTSNQTAERDSRKILRAKFLPWDIFQCFFPKKDSPIYLFWSPVSPNFDGVKFFYSENHQLILQST